MQKWNPSTEIVRQRIAFISLGSCSFLNPISVTLGTIILSRGGKPGERPCGLLTGGRSSSARNSTGSRNLRTSLRKTEKKPTPMVSDSLVFAAHVSVPTLATPDLSHTDLPLAPVILPLKSFHQIDYSIILPTPPDVFFLETLPTQCENS